MQHRTLTRQMADDLGLLEEHAQQKAAAGLEAVELRFAAALVRNLLGPWLENRPTKPLHIAVVGGAGAGKSTIVNFLCGGPVAEANPQAGYTRHPVAYVAANLPLAWGDYLGFLGPLQRLGRPSDSHFDEDVYQIRRVSDESKDRTLLESTVVWDCPDMTTAAATGYQARMLEAAALADVIVYVASDERYNDEIPTSYLDLFLRAGKAVVVCLVKVRAAEAEAFVDHFRKDVLSRLDGTPAALIFVPQLGYDQLQDPVEKAPAERQRLLDAVRSAGKEGEAARRTNVQAALAYLRKREEYLTKLARADLGALEEWRKLVEEGRREFDERYRREYLTGERFRRFDDAYARLVEMLELPGMGKAVAGLLYLLRTPYRVVRSWFASRLLRGPGPTLAEKPVLDAALTGWLDLLRKEATRRAGQHPLWSYVRDGFGGSLQAVAEGKFEEGWRAFQLSEATEVESAARRLVERLQSQPAALNTLRALKLATDFTVGFLLFYHLGIGLWAFLLIPLAVSLTQHLFELIVAAYVDGRREAVRKQQQLLLGKMLSGPLSARLSEWPATGGSMYERLKGAVERLGPGLAEMEQASA